ncbi:MAG: LexA family transcriptional regulator, partial [Hymenobacteraceae bacterium]|nr:LexA family transcriptional regulator [Hymenobacteraceae bacterium]MDX5396529.1 LexA family transcriptional regulator [Hymenobacteraceae bacterium]MDX5512590.1 LexA family transcriptional regulator [Hymenobacteraceae bacterium]
MSFIGKNIKKIRTVKKLSQASFAQLFNLARPSVGAYEEGRSEPKMETVVQISQYFGLSIDLLLTKELTVNELYGFDIFKKDFHKDPSLIKVAAAAEKQAQEARLVRAKQALEYIVNHHDPQYLDKLPAITLPATETGISRAFEMGSSEMQYQQNGLHPGDILFCAPADKTDLEALQPGQVYVAVLPDKLLMRRLQVSSFKNKLAFKADNPDYAVLNIAITD